MRKIDVWMGAALWALVAVLLPMSALEPVGAAAQAAVAPSQPVAAASCDGSARLAMGCESMHL